MNKEKATLYKALSAAQSEMTKAKKDSLNPHFKSKYADLSSVQDACMSALLKHGFAVIQPTGVDENGPHVQTIFVHESGESIECKVPILFGENMQKYGSAMTYARRYGLMTLAGIAPEDDDGHVASSAVEQQAKPAKKGISEPTETAIYEAGDKLECFPNRLVFESWITEVAKRDVADMSEELGKKVLAFLVNNPRSADWGEPHSTALDNAIAGQATLGV